MGLIKVSCQVSNVCQPPGRLVGNELFSSFKTGNPEEAANADTNTSLEIPLYLPLT